MGELESATRSLLSLEPLLNRPVLRDRADDIRAALAASRLVVIHDAIREVYSERVWRALYNCEAWEPHEGAQPDFHFRHHNLYDPSAFPPELLECRLFFDSPETKSTMARLSGRDCSAALQFAASWYMPGDYSLPHDDASDIQDHLARRQVAFIWHLTKDWDERWGGHLYWGPSQQMIRPSYNSLYLFSIGLGHRHFVAPVAGRAIGKRLTVNGWWTGVSAYPDPAASPGRESLVF